MIRFPAGPFDLIYADPPFYWRGWSKKGEGRSPQRHYRCPPMSELVALPVAETAAPDSVLAIWVYGPRLPDTLTLLGAWGFSYKSEGFVWVKIDKRGLPLMGNGKSTRKEAETLWLASRGKGLRRFDKGVRQVIFAHRRRHSRKPDEAAERLERLYGPVRRIELFATERRLGWTPWGDQVPVSDIATMSSNCSQPAMQSATERVDAAL